MDCLISDKRDDFYFEIINFSFFDVEVLCSTSYGVYISYLIRFARAYNIDGWLRMGLLPPREFCRQIITCRELKAESFKKCLHSVLRGVSL